MTLQQQGHILAALIWLVILLGPPLALALLAPMFYVDGAMRGANLRSVRVDNRVTLLILLISLCIWLLLLKFLYLPTIGFDTGFLTIGSITRYDYTDLATLRTLGNLTLDWIRSNPISAVALLAFVPLIGASVLFVARAQGRAASAPTTPQTRWR